MWGDKNLINFILWISSAYLCGICMLPPSTCVCLPLYVSVIMSLKNERSCIYEMVYGEIK